MEASGEQVYLDHNATSMMTEDVVEAMTRWCNRGLPSTDSEDARRLVEAFRQEIAVWCGFERTAYDVVFTSGASESNAMIVTGAVRAYASRTGRMPHVVVSAAEHVSVLLCARRLAREKMCQLTVLDVGRAGAADLGLVTPAALHAALRPNTCLISIVAAARDTGALNDLKALARVARTANVPFHSDAAQLFGRAHLRPGALGLDAFSATFHKLGGPPGVGVLVVSRRLVLGYDLSPLVYGPQSGGLRGGAENVPGLAAGFAAYRAAMADRAAKTARVQRLRDAARSRLAAAGIQCFGVDAHPSDPLPSLDGGITPERPPRHRGTPEGREAIARAGSRTPLVFWVAPGDPGRVLPNTLLVAVRRVDFSARATRAALERRDVVVGVVPRADLAYLDLADALTRGGLLRVSLGDDTTAEDVERFARCLAEVLLSDECVEPRG
ncbi:MAG: aminotransferase class V-fold PLP-dependent enzyme [Gemmatimonadaceae bacterium]|jgi:cysteine desulfurase